MLHARARTHAYIPYSSNDDSTQYIIKVNIITAELAGRRANAGVLLDRLARLFRALHRLLQWVFYPFCYLVDIVFNSLLNPFHCQSES